jgi:hypothetical protein
MAEIINFKGSKVLPFDEWRGYEGVPEHTRGALSRYRDKGYEPGSFLYSVLNNDLFGAVGRADAENSRAIKDICGWVYNRMPSTSWGSIDKIEAWIKQGGLEGARKQQIEEAE